MIKFNKNNGTIEPFTIILANRNQEHLGEIVNTEGVNFTGNFNAADELSFTVHKMKDGKEERLWDEIYDLRLVYIKEVNEYFEINVSFTDQTYLTKTITAKSLCEAELSQTMLYGIEINTEIDIERDDYKVAKFWTNNTDPQSAEYKSTILFRVLEKVPAYTVKHVDVTLVDLQRVFKIDGKSVYDWLVNDCATEFNCLVKFDSTDRTISFYDLYTTCPVCHHRGLFNDSCPHVITDDDIEKYGVNGAMPNGVTAGFVCGNTENLGYYGDDTTILVSTENLTDEIKYDTDVDSIKNSFRLEAGDDDMTAALVNINPNGSQYIYNYSPESLKDMPLELVSAIQEYNDLYNYYKYSAPSNFSVDSYNSLVDKYATMYAAYHDNEETLLPINNPIKGYAKLMERIYQAFDFYSFLESSMMPKLDLPSPTAASEAAKIEAGMVDQYTQSTVGLSTFSSRTEQETVESALVNYAKAMVYTGFVSVSVETTSYTKGNQSGTWVGRFKVKHNSLEETDDDAVAYTRTMTLTINGDYEKYIVQKIKKKIAKDEEEGLELTSLFMMPELANFKIEIKKYSLNRLRSFKDTIDAVLGIMQEANIAVKPALQKSSIKRDLYSNFYLPFLNKYNAVEEEFNLRAKEVKIVARYEDGILTGGMLRELLERKEEINDILDFKKFLDKKSAEFNIVGIPTKIATPIMTSNNTNGYVASCSNRYNSNYEPFYAFNRNHGGDRYTWATTNSLPQWIQIKFPSAVCIRKLITFNRNESNIRAVSTFVFQGSNNGSSWTNIQTCNIASSAAHYKATFDIDNTTNYLYYRLYCTGNFNNATGTGCGFSDIEMYMPDEEYAVDFYTLLTTYTRQDTYSNSNYISTSLNNGDLFLMAQMFYDAAYEELAKASIYQHSISANLYNLLAMDEFKPLQDKFELGNWLRMATDDKVYRLRLISYSVNFDDPTHLDTQFSDVTQTGNGYNDLASLLNQAGTMATSFPAVERQAELGKLAHYGIDEWLKTGLDSTKTRIMNNNNEEIEITNVGITAKTYNDITDSYDDEQLRITHNVLAFTDDNWKTVATALGKFTFTYHVPHLPDSSTPQVEQREDYGLVAKAVLAGHVVSSIVEGSTIISGHIQNPSNSTYISLTDETWTDYNNRRYDYFIDANHNFQVTREGNVRLRGGHISNMDDTNFVDLHAYNPNSSDSSEKIPFFLQVANSFYITKTDGTIISKNGRLQNMDNTVYIDCGDGSRYKINNEGQIIGTEREDYFLMCGEYGSLGSSSFTDYFSVTKNGYLKSIKGYIGGFYISDTYISSTQTLSDTNNSHITLSLQGFTRRLNVPVATYSGSGNIDTMVITPTDISSLRFAIGDSLGVTSDGSIYMRDLYANKLDVGNIACISVQASDTIFAHNTISGNKCRFGLIKIEDNKIDNVGDLVTPDVIIQNKFKITLDGMPYVWMGSDDIGGVGGDWYQLMPVLVGYDDPPTLPANVIYLRIEA